MVIFIYNNSYIIKHAVFIFIWKSLYYMYVKYLFLLHLTSEMFALNALILL